MVFGIGWVAQRRLAKLAVEEKAVGFPGVGIA